MKFTVPNDLKCDLEAERSRPLNKATVLHLTGQPLKKVDEISPSNQTPKDPQ